MSAELSGLSNRQKKKAAAAIANAEQTADRVDRAKDAAMLLLESLKSIAGNGEYETEYDGRMYIVCHDCGDLGNGRHKVDCSYTRALALIASIEQLKE
jgi:hypothetical protein